MRFLGLTAPVGVQAAAERLPPDAVQQPGQKQAILPGAVVATRGSGVLVGHCKPRCVDAAWHRQHFKRVTCCCATCAGSHSSQGLFGGLHFRAFFISTAAAALLSLYIRATWHVKGVGSVGDGCLSYGKPVVKSSTTVDMHCTQHTLLCTRHCGRQAA